MFLSCVEGCFKTLRSFPWFSASAGLFARMCAGVARECEDRAAMDAAEAGWTLCERFLALVLEPYSVETFMRDLRSRRELEDPQSTNEVGSEEESSEEVEFLLLEGEDAPAHPQPTEAVEGDDDDTEWDVGRLQEKRAGNADVDDIWVLD